MHLRKIKRGKRGQGVMSLPFGMIFSIILIIIFVVIAFYVIKNWLDLQKCTKVGLFYDDLQDKVNEAYSGTGYADWMEISLPSGVEEVCFADLTKRQSGKFRQEYDEIERFKFYDANTFMYPGGEACEIEYHNTNHLDMDRITETNNPYCISTSKKIQVSYEYGGKGILLREKS